MVKKKKKGSGKCPASGCIKKVGSDYRVISNKTGKAVRRNLAKRRMRAAAGELLGRIEGGQMIFIARRGIDELSYAEIKSQMTSLLEKSGMLKANGGAT